MNSGDYSDFCRDLMRPLPAKSEQPPLPARQRKPLPTGAEGAGIEVDGDHGEIRTGALASAPQDWADLLRSWDLDPDVWEVVEPVRRSSWEQRSADGDVSVLNSYRARIQRRRSGGVDVDALMAEIRDHVPHAAAPGGRRAFVLVPADFQAGKSDPQLLVQRFMAAVDGAVRRLAQLRESGADIGPVYILFAGDLIENVSNWYPEQNFLVALNLTEQLRLVRRLMLHMVKMFAPLTSSLVLASVPGNHEEAARNGGGKNTTNSADSHAVELLSQVADVLAENPAAYGHVRFVAPPKDDPLVATLDICGTPVAVAHGHQFPGKDGHRWWQGQAAGMRPAGEATVLFSGHYHTLKIVQSGPRLWAQVPCLDVAGSGWYADRTGEESPTGLLSMIIGGGGWDGLAIH